MMIERHAEALLALVSETLTVNADGKPVYLLSIETDWSERSGLYSTQRPITDTKVMVKNEDQRATLIAGLESVIMKVRSAETFDQYKARTGLS